MNVFRKLFLLFLPLFCVFTLQAQEGPPPITLENPYNTVYVHLYYLQSDSYEPLKAARTIYGVKDTVKAKRLAIQIKQILDGKGLYVDLYKLPTEPDYFDSTSNEYYYSLFPVELPELYLERIDGKWYYSRSSLKQVPEIHKKMYPFGSDFLVNLFPKFGHYQVLGLAVWQLFGILILLGAAFLLHLILSWLLNPLVSKLSQSRLYPSLIPKRLIRKIARLASILLIIQLLRLFIPVLKLPIELSTVLVTGFRIVTTIILVMLALRILEVVLKYVAEFTSSTDSKLDDQLIPIIRRAVELIILIIGIFNILYLLNVNIAALIAGISIGGLALALAAQDTVKNLIGSAMIFLDRPFQIGDYIVGSGFEGSVVEVGFRTTRIQTIDSSVISVPNGTIANLSVTNLGVRVYRLLNTKLGLTYDTPADKIELFMKGLEEIIHAHPMTRKEGYYVRFTEMADSSLNIMWRVAILTDDYAKELEVKQGLYLAALRLAEAIGVSFAFPSTSVYVEQMPGTQPAVSIPQPRVSSDQEKMNEFIAKLKEQYSQQEPGADQL